MPVPTETSMRGSILQKGCATARHAANTGLIADGWFGVDQAISSDARTVEIVSEIPFPPTLRGYASLSSLTVGISRGPTPLDLMQDFVETSLSAIMDAQILDIMY
jgi:hypothetical protein